MGVVNSVVSMASIRRIKYKDGRTSPYWIACFRLHDGTQIQRSTKERNRQAAERQANKMEDAEKMASKGELTEMAARKIISEIYESATGDKLEFYSIESWFRQWLDDKSKGHTRETTVERYRVAIDRLLDHVKAKKNKNIKMLSQKDVQGYIN